MRNRLIIPLLLSAILVLISNQPIFSQLVHDHHHSYFADPDPLVGAKLEKWQDLKFGLLMHWGTYSQWGIVESWSICPEDYGWCKRVSGQNPQSYNAYKKEYENLITTFNPIEFNPGQWAKAAKQAGMKYVVFTTKHHDGFCMWDTKETDYKITSGNCPFHTNARADVTKEIFNAFREKDFWVGAYFSKPDWHSENYWWPYFPPFDRNVNYDPAQYPERWENFTQFTHNQIMELMSGYGKIDILWLDGGWVAKKDENSIRNTYKNRIQQTSTGFLKSGVVNQDIRMDELVGKARSKQPGLIVVDRAVPGQHQNYLTPENTVPDQAIPYPWESCIIAGGGWSWVPPEKAVYKSPRETIHMLADIVSKGGNLLLNIAPGPKGNWHPDAYKLLEQVGQWMEVNSEAIYGTRAIKPYKEGNVCLTHKPESNTLYAIYLAGAGETGPPANVSLGSIQPAGDAEITMLGIKHKLKWESTGNGFTVKIPKSIRDNPPGDHAWVLKINKIKQPPTDADGRPLILKSGTIDGDLVETSPVVFKNKVYRFEYVRAGYWDNQTGDSYFRFVDRETGKSTKSFAKGFHLGSAFVHDDRVYVTAVDIWNGEEIHLFTSDDLENWDSWKIIDLPGYGIFNTSLIRAEEKYVLMFEIGKPESEAGKRFTARFATSTDLKKWQVLPSDHNYAKDRYTAPHCLRYLDGYYYDFYLEAYDGYESRVVRSKDLIDWIPSPLNPVLKASATDKNIANTSLPEAMLQRIAKAKNINNSDIDFCEFNGRLIINYSWGNQRGEEFLAEAIYEGTLEQFLEGWFPH